MKHKLSNVNFFYSFWYQCSIHCLMTSNGGNNHTTSIVTQSMQEKPSYFVEASTKIIRQKVLDNFYSKLIMLLQRS